AFFGSGGVGVEDADGINLHVGLPNLCADLALGVAGAVVAAVGDDEQGLALVAGIFHLGHTIIDSVEQGGPMSAAYCGQARGYVFSGRGEVLNELGAIVESDDEELVLRV